MVKSKVDIGEDRFAVGLLFNAAGLVPIQCINCQVRGSASPDVAVSQMNN